MNFIRGILGWLSSRHPLSSVWCSDRYCCPGSPTPTGFFLYPLRYAQYSLHRRDNLFSDFGSVTRGTFAAERLFIGLGHPVQKSAEQTFWFQILFRIFYKCRSAVFGTEIIGTAFVRVNRMGWFRVYVHAANRILNTWVLSGHHFRISVIRPSGCLCWIHPEGFLFRRSYVVCRR